MTDEDDQPTIPVPHSEPGNTKPTAYAKSELVPDEEHKAAAKSGLEAIFATLQNRQPPRVPEEETLK